MLLIMLNINAQHNTKIKGEEELRQQVNNFLENINLYPSNPQDYIISIENNNIILQNLLINTQPESKYFEEKIKINKLTLNTYYPQLKDYYNIKVKKKNYTTSLYNYFNENSDIKEKLEKYFKNLKLKISYDYYSIYISNDENMLILKQLSVTIKSSLGNIGSSKVENTLFRNNMIINSIELPLKKTTVNIDFIQNNKDRRSQRQDPEATVLLNKLKDDKVFNFELYNYKIKYNNRQLTYPTIFGYPKDINIKLKVNSLLFFNFNDTKLIKNNLNLNFCTSNTSYITLDIRNKTTNEPIHNLNIELFYIINDNKKEKIYSNIDFNNGEQIKKLYNEQNVVYELLIEHNDYEKKIVAIKNDNLNQTFTIKLKPKISNYDIYFNASDNNIKEPDPISVNIPKSVPDNGYNIKENIKKALNNQWEVVNLKDYKLYPDDLLTQSKKINIKRKTNKNLYTFVITKNVPSDIKIYYILNDYLNNNEIKEVISNEFIINATVPFYGENYNIKFIKPKGYNIYKQDENKNNNWKKDTLFINLNDKTPLKINLNIDKNPTFNFYYIDVSDCDNRSKLIEQLKNKLDKNIENGNDFSLYISNGDKPIKANTNNTKDIINIYTKIATLNTQIPIYSVDKIDILKILNPEKIMPERRKEVFLNFYCSERSFDSWEQLISSGEIDPRFKLNKNSNNIKIIIIK